MRRRIVVALIIGCLCSCGAGVWVAREAMIAPFVLPGASDLVVTPHGLDDLGIDYRAGAGSFSWRDRISQRLSGMGWNGRLYTFGSRTPFTLTSYTHELELGPFTLTEHAIVGGNPNDPNAVQIRVYHELHLRR